MQPIEFTARREPSGKNINGGSLTLGWFVIPYKLVDGEDGKKLRRVLTGQWFKIKSADSHIYRVLRFSTSMTPDKQTASAPIALDYDGWLKLSKYAEHTPASMTLTLSRARWYEKISCGIHHPDPTFRLSSYLGVISVVLGVIGVILGVLGICFSLKPLTPSNTPIAGPVSVIHIGTNK